MIDVNKRRAVSSSLTKYCIFAKDNDFMEVTEWASGEGYDISIYNNCGDKSFSLTHGEFELLQVLINYKGD